jgi:hypothetical protein
MTISVGLGPMLLVYVAIIGGVCLLVRLLLYRHSSRQAERMRMVDAMWIETKPPAQTAREAKWARSAERVAAMSTTTEPYRAPPAQAQADAELARLASQGQRRVHSESMRQDSEQKERFEWVRLWRLHDAMKLLPGAPHVQASPESLPAEAEFPPGEFVPGDDERVGPPPLEFVEAAARKAHAEALWLASLPFAMERYFAILAEEAQETSRIDITVTLHDAGGAPSHDTLEGVVHVHDVAAEVTEGASGSIEVRSGALSGRTGAAFIYTNENIAPYVHGFVDRVLRPLHRSRPIARVSLARE